MNIFFYLAFAYITLYGCLTFFLNKEKIPRIAKGLMIVATIGAVIILVKYQIIEKQEQKYSEYMASMERRDISKKLGEMKEKERKGLLADVDYGRYIALHLENINLTLKNMDSRSTREWVAVYYEAVNKIPIYLSHQEWKDSEKFIYDSMVNEINGNFASRNISKHRRIERLGTFKKERDKLLQAKEREFSK